MLLNALKRLGGHVTDKAKLAAAMRSIDLLGPRGPVTLDKKCEQEWVNHFVHDSSGRP